MDGKLSTWVLTVAILTVAAAAGQEPHISPVFDLTENSMILTDYNSIREVRA